MNLTTERAYITAPAHVSPPELVKVIQAAGYSAELARPRPDAEFTSGFTADGDTVRRLRRRLILALVFFVPLTDLWPPSP